MSIGAKSAAKHGHATHVLFVNCPRLNGAGSITVLITRLRQASLAI